MSKRSGLLCAALCALAGAALADAPLTGSIAGRVTDGSNGRPVGDAKIIIRGEALQNEAQQSTDALGRFEVSLLPPALYYSVIVLREGFQPRMRNVEVRPGQTTQIKCYLVPDSISFAEEWPDWPEASVSSDPGATFTRADFKLLPFGRTTSALDAVLSHLPGVIGEGHGAHVRGAPTSEVGFSIEGADVRDPAYGYLATPLILDFLDFADVRLGSLRAEEGGSSGARVAAALKSGGNEFHGSVFARYSPYEAARRQVATGTVSAETSQRSSLELGAELGGPIVKDRLWFFAGFAPQLVSLGTDRVIRAVTANADGTLQVDGSGNAIRHEVARQGYDNKLSAFQYAAKLTAAPLDDHRLSLALFGRAGGTSGVQGSVLGTEGTFLGESSLGTIDASLRYQGRLFGGALLIEAALTAHHQTGTAGDAAPIDVQGTTAAKLRDTPLIIWAQPHSLLGPALVDATTPASQAMLSVCAVQSNGFEPCPVLNYASGGLGLLRSSTLDRQGAALALGSLFSLLGRHHAKVGAQLSAASLSRDELFSGGTEFVAAGRGETVTGYLGSGYGHQDVNAPGLPALDPRNPGHRAGEQGALHSHDTWTALFAQDTWSLGDRLVVDAGVRLEWQRFAADGNYLDAGGNPVGSVGATPSGLLPRVALIGDPLGGGRTKVYASYGRSMQRMPLDQSDQLLASRPLVFYATNATSCGDLKDPRTCAVIPRAGPNQQTYYFADGRNNAADPALAAITDELAGGLQARLARDLSIGADAAYEDLGAMPAATAQSNYTLASTGALHRRYRGVTVWLEKALADDWLVRASYTLSSLRGTSEGPLAVGAGELSAMPSANYGDAQAPQPNRDGPLPGDSPNSFRADAAWRPQLSARTSLSAGASLRAAQGGPTSYLGADQFQGAGATFILPRNAGGRLPWTWQLDLRGELFQRLGNDFGAGLSLDVLNATDNRAVTAIDQNYTFNRVAPIVNGSVSDLQSLKSTDGTVLVRNSNFQGATAYQLPLALRLGARLVF